MKTGRPPPPAPLEADDVEAGEAGAIADHAAERNDVGLDAGDAADHRGTADTDILVKRGRPHDHRMVADADMATHHRVVRDDDVVAERAVVRDMCHRHQQAIGADPGDAVATDAGAMDGAVLAHLSAGADLATCRLVAVFEVLRRQADRAEGVEHDLGADARVAIDHDMRDELRAVLDDGVGTDGAVRADAHAGAEFGATLDDGGGVDGGACGVRHDQAGGGIHGTDSFVHATDAGRDGDN